MTRIAVDAMGGDFAPGPEIEGALAAIAERSIDVFLVGDRSRIDTVLAGRSHPRLRICHASQTITMDDRPSAAVKAKKDSSMRICFDLAVRGEVDAVVSAGNSGAMMACGLFVMKRLPGVERPGIVAVAPTVQGGHSVVLDVGANTELKPTALAQFAVLGSAYMKLMLGVSKPRVGVLSNGEESSKGNDLTREVHRMLASPPGPIDFDFRGYAEGRDICAGDFDVIVTDGFTGNICLKTFEGALTTVFDLLRTEVAKSGRAKLGALLMKPAFLALKRRIEPDEFGGAPLLGVHGVVIICHGRANAKAIKNGILSAERLVAAQVAPSLEAAIARHAPIWTT